MHSYLTRVPTDIVSAFYLKEYALQMKSEGLTWLTIEYHLTYTYQFIKFSKFEDPRDYWNIVKIRFSYLGLFEGEKENLSNDTRYKYYKTIKKYSEFLRDMEIIEDIQITKIKKPRLAKTLPYSLDEDGIEKLYDALVKHNSYSKFYNMRNYVMVETMIYSGLRRAEVANLKVSDFKKDHIFVRSGKGQKDRAVPLPKKLQETLTGWLDIRKKLPGESIFCDAFGGELKTRAISDVFNRISKRLWFRVHPHMLRHSYATMCVKKWVNIYSIQQAMWHSDIRITSQYFQMGIKEQVEEMQKLNY